MNQQPNPTSPSHAHVRALVQAALAAADPARAVARWISREGDRLHAGERTYDLRACERVFVIGGGKAGAAMAGAVEQVLGEQLTAGWVNVKHGHRGDRPLRRVTLHEAGHPLPDAAGVEGTRRMLELVDNLTARDLVICVLSGGASALLVDPVEGVTLAHLQALTGALLACGATINEINAVRKHLSRVKGGRLAQRLAPAQVLALILSDVVGSPLDTIASGPTVPDPTTFAAAWAILEKYRLTGELPPAIVDHLARGVRGEVPETPKPSDPAFERVHNLIVGSNVQAAQAALAQAEALGYHALLLSTYVEGEAREVGRVLAALAKEEIHHARPLPLPACLIAGGETTVTLQGEGRGGRNQELALSAALALDGWPGATVVALATDGTDGPTDAAGAVARGDTVQRAAALGLDASAHLARNDAYPFFEALGDLLRTGPTGTNVNDLVFVIVEGATP